MPKSLILIVNFGIMIFMAQETKFKDLICQLSVKHSKISKKRNEIPPKRMKKQEIS